MNERANGSTNYRGRSPILVVVGVLLLLLGAAAAFLGPLEMYCFYLFSEGGRFHYPGFGFGSFMFGNIAAQILGYYLIAAVAIPLGYGHLAQRRWARPLSLALLWFWLVLGIPLTLLFLLVLLASKEVSVVAALFAVFVMGAAYFVLPALLIRFYRSRDVRLTLEARDPHPHWLERLPVPVLVLCLLDLFYLVVLHVLILFNGLFPLFGVFLSGLPGIVALDLSIMCLACLAWGTFRQRAWAWWGSLVYWGWMTCSAVLTLARSSYLDILAELSFPPTEIEFLDGVPLQGYHLAAFIGLPLAMTLGAILSSRRHFTATR